MASRDEEEDVEVIDFFGLGGRLLLFVLFAPPFLADAAASFLVIRGLLEEFCLLGLLLATTGDTASVLFWPPTDTVVTDGGVLTSGDLFSDVLVVVGLQSGKESWMVLAGDDGGEAFSFLGDSSFQFVTSPI